MNVITIEEHAFYELLETVLKKLNEKKNEVPDKWIDTKEAMKMLRICSKTTLQKYRDQGKIRFSQPDKKLILYDRDSILTFLALHAKEVFR